MWCEVKVCRGSTGERRKRADWTPIGCADLEIAYCRGNNKISLCANLWRYDLDRQVQVAVPLFDVRVHTYDTGLLVIGFVIAPDQAANVAREYRQAWYCAPTAR
jgi:hypothetical protein